MKKLFFEKMLDIIINFNLRRKKKEKVGSNEEKRKIAYNIS